MYIQTKNQVEYNLPMRGTAINKVKGRLMGITEDGAISYMKMKFGYFDEEEVVIGQGIADYTKDDFNALMEQIKADLPDVNATPWDVWRLTQLYTAFIQVMAVRLEIAPADIEIINE